MIWLFNGSSVLFVILFVVGFVLLNAFASTTVLDGRQIFPLFGLKAPNDFVSFMFFILWLALTILIPYWYAIRKYKKLNNLLLEKCDPTQYINVGGNRSDETAGIQNEKGYREACQICRRKPAEMAGR